MGDKRDPVRRDSDPTLRKGADGPEVGGGHRTDEAG